MISLPSLISNRIRAVQNHYISRTQFYLLNVAANCPSGRYVP